MKKINTLAVILVAIGLCFTYTYFDNIDDFTPIPAAGMDYYGYVTMTLFNSFTMVLLTPFILRLRKEKKPSLKKHLILIGIFFQAILTYSSLSLHNEVVCQWTTCDWGFALTFLLSFFIKWVAILYTSIFLALVYYFSRPKNTTLS